VTPPVEIVDVSLAEVDPGLIAGFALERPVPGSSEGDRAGEAFGVRVEGWAVGAAKRVVAIEVKHDHLGFRWLPLLTKRDDVLTAIEAAKPFRRCGFEGALNTLALPPEFELAMNAVFEDETRVEVVRLRGRRRALEPVRDARLEPLMVSTLGRTGSTVLLRALDAHRGIVAYRPFQYEPKVVSYWLDLFLALSEPASYMSQVVQPSDPSEDWWLGRRAKAPELIDAHVQEWLGVAGVERLAAFCGESIEALYSRVADDARRGDALYFAEKLLPNAAPWLMWELFPAAREILLVRDFRDMACSIIAYNAAREMAAFGRDKVESDSEYVRQLGAGVTSLAREWRTNGRRAHLVRYEELITEPDRTLEAILEYLELGTEDLPDMKERLLDQGPAFEQHGTAPSAAESIGRWRHELGDELRQACDEAFGESLELFGYER
jgi:hypothetical protein